MSEWDDRFKDHAVHSALAAVLRNLDELEGEIEGTDILELFSRLYRVMKYAKSQLDTVDPEFVSTAVIDELGKQFETINPRLENFFDKRTTTPLVNSNADADLVLDLLARLPRLETPSDLEGLGQDVSAFRQRVNGVVQKLEKHVSGFMDEFKKQEEGFRKDTQSLSERVQEIANRIKDQDSTISAQKQHLDNITAQFQAQFTEAQSKRETDYSQKSSQQDEAVRALRDKIEGEMKEFFNQRQQKADELFTQHSQQAKEAINSLNTEVKTRVGDLETQATTLLDALKKEETEFFAEQQKEASARIGTLDADIEKSKELVKLVSDIAVTGDYANIANEERKTADRLRWIGLGLMGLMVVLAFFTLNLLVEKGFDWGIAFYRVVSIGIVGIPAFYLVKESDKHRQNERRNRKYQLELTAIDPYLKTMPQPEQDKLKATLAERFFGQPEPISETDDIVKGKTVFGLLEHLVKELVKKMR